METKSHTDYICHSLKDEEYFKIRIIHQTPERMSVVFLESTIFCHIGYYKWYYKNEFFSIFELIDTDDQISQEIEDVLFIEGEKQFREKYFQYKNK
jgi:hypothetical protein